MRRLAGVVVGIVLVITSGGRAQAQRRIRFESLGTFELFRRLLDDEGKTSLRIGGAVGLTRAGTGASEGLAALSYAAGTGHDFVALDARLAAVAAGENEMILDGTHRALARTGNVKLDLAIDHSSIGRSFSLRSDVAPEPYRDVSLGAGLDTLVKSLDRDGAIVVPLTVRGRRVTYTGGRPGLTSVEVSAGVGARFAGRRATDGAGQGKGALGNAEMFGVSYIGTRIEAPAAEAPAAGADPGAARLPAVMGTTDMGSAAGGQALHEVDIRLLNYDQVFFHEGPFSFAMYIRMGYGHIENQTTGADGGAPIFRYGMQAEDKTGGIGLLYSIAPGVSDTGEIVSVWRVEALARGRKQNLGAWDARFAWTCATPDDTDDVCGEGAVGRAALELEGYVELSRRLQLGASYLGDYGPWRGTREWRNEALAFLRWDVTR